MSFVSCSLNTINNSNGNYSGIGDFGGSISSKDPVYTVSFECNGGTKIPSQTCSTLSAPPHTTREGHVFEGWYRDSSLINPVVFPLDIRSNIKLYAKWLKVKDERICSNTSIKYIDNSLSSEVRYQITPSGFDLQELANKGYRIKIEVEYDYYYKKDYDVLFDVGYMGSPKYDVSITNSDNVGQFKENLSTEKSVKTRKITYTANAIDYMNTIIYLKFSTDNIQNIIYFKNIKVTYTAYQ